MTKYYDISSVSYELQDKGYWSGRACIFVNVEKKRRALKMTASDVLLEVATMSDNCRFVVLTGRHSAQQVDHALVDRLHDHGYYVAIETDGTTQYPWNVDWVTFTPRAETETVINVCDELVLVYHDERSLRNYEVKTYHRFIQPSNTRDATICNAVIGFLDEHTDWRLSLKYRKRIKIR